MATENIQVKNVVKGDKCWFLLLCRLPGWVLSVRKVTNVGFTLSFDRVGAVAQ